MSYGKASKGLFRGLTIATAICTCLVTTMFSDWRKYDYLEAIFAACAIVAIVETISFLLYLVRLPRGILFIIELLASFCGGIMCIIAGIVSRTKCLNTDNTITPCSLPLIKTAPLHATAMTIVVGSLALLVFIHTALKQ